MRHSSSRSTPVEAALEILDGPWRTLIAWYLFWGPRPFDELITRLDGITKEILRRELAEMERWGLVRKDSAPRRRVEYSLTSLGETLKPLLAAMYEWGLGVLNGAGDRARNRETKGGARSVGDSAPPACLCSPSPSLPLEKETPQ